MGMRWFAAASSDEVNQLAYSLFADSHLKITKSSPDNIELKYTLSVWEDSSPFGISTNGSNSQWGSCYDTWPRISQSSGPKYMINGMSNALGRTSITNDTSIGTTYLQFDGGRWFNGAITEDTIAQSLSFLSFITMLLWPTFVYRIIYEREEQLFHMMRISGMKTSTYWIANYTFDFGM
jgi:hypothetical protein